MEVDPITFKLPFTPPYNWAAVVRFLLPRVTPGLETVSLERYRRGVAVDGVHAVVELAPVAEQPYLQAHLYPSSDSTPSEAALKTLCAEVAERSRQLFDLDANSPAIDAHLRRDPQLATSVAALPGLRIPGAWDTFELAVRAILGQQISVAAATKLARRLVETYGEPLKLKNLTYPHPELRFVFPQPAALAIADLTELGMPRARAKAIASLAAAVAQTPTLFQSFQNLDDAIRKLCQLPGIGEWTAHYIAMRALHESDALPATDLGLLRSLGDSKTPATKMQLLETAEQWRPWRAYGAMHLWLRG